jgi:AcrR family transcriptional regulator
MNQDGSGPATGAREQNKRAKLRRIARAAWTLFRRDGFEATTTRAVAEAAGVASGTLFLYARDKGDLLVLAFQDAVAAALEQAAGTLPAGAPFVDRLMHLFGAFIRLHDQDRDLARHFSREWLVTGEAPREPMTRLTRRLLDALATQVVLAQQAGELQPSLAPAEVSMTCLGLYDATVTFWLGGWLGAGDTPDAHLRRALALFVRGLGPPGAPTGSRQVALPSSAIARPVGAGRSPTARCRVTIFGDHDEFVD